jgi:hypothetical protein
MTLDEAVKKCRELGITKFRGDTTTGPVEFELGPAPAPAAQVEEEFKVPEVDKDGLTAAEQLEIYGVVIDAEE